MMASEQPSLLNSLKKLVSWRQPGGLVSAVSHLALLVASFAAFSSAKPFEAASESVPVDIVSEKDFTELTKGARDSKLVLPEPQRRVDKIAETKSDKDPGEAKKDIAAEPPKVEPAPEPPPSVPTPPARVAIAPPTPAQVPPAPPTPPIPPARPPELRVAPPPEPIVKDDAPDDAEAELSKQKPIKRVEPKKDEIKPADLTKLLEDKQREEDKRKAEAEKKALEKEAAEIAAREAREKEKREALRAAQEKAAQEKASQEKLALEKAVQSKNEQAKNEQVKKEKAAKEAAEAKKLEESIKNRLLASKEQAASTGSTGATLQKQASLGAPEATGRKMSASERSQIIGILTEQMNRCLSIPPGAFPKGVPIVALSLSREGMITGGPRLTNPSSETGFTPFAEANMRALRACQPFRIPARFQPMYDDWKNLNIGLLPPDF